MNAMARTAFDNAQYADVYPPGIERSWWQVARNQVIARTLAARLPRSARILEVGCGTGIVVAHLHAQDWEVTGVDIGEPGTGVRGPEHLLLGTDATRLPGELRATFTALALFDVIEHVPDPSAFLRDLLAAFPNVEHVVITVPARKELWTNFDEHVGHFRRYDRVMVRDELRNAGLRADHIAYFFHALYPVIALNNLIRGRRRDVRFHAPAEGLPSVMHNMLGDLFALEARSLPNGLVGSSLIAVAERTAPAST